MTVISSERRVDNRFLAVNSCGVHVEKYHRTERPEGRMDYHLLYVESGGVSAVIDGREESIGPGGFVLYPPYAAQDYRTHGGVCYWTHFTGRDVEEVLSSAQLPLLYAGCAADPAISRRFEKLLYTLATQQPNRELLLAADLAALLAQLGASAQMPSAPCGDDRLREVIVYMNKHYPEPLTVDELASRCALSKSRFIHLFSQSTGMPPYAYLLSLRLGRAVEALLSSDLPISQIAYEAGFSDPLYFSRLFKKHHGVSPEAFRRGQPPRALPAGSPK